MTQTSNHCRKHRRRGMVSRYPWPTKVTFDCGSEFIGHEFKKMLNDYGVKKKAITTRNPQANAIVERVHQAIGNIIRTFELHDNYLDEDDPWKGILAATAFAIRATYHTTLQKSPGQLVFGRDMIFNFQHTANCEYIHARKQRLIQKNNKMNTSLTSLIPITSMIRSCCARVTRTNMRRPLVGLIKY